jgi:hypothetical protein
MSIAVTFAVLTESWSAVTASCAVTGITDCPMTAITVTRCDGRGSTDVRYPPPYGLLVGGHGGAFGQFAIGAGESRRDRRPTEPVTVRRLYPLRPQFGSRLGVVFRTRPEP